MSRIIGASTDATKKVRCSSDGVPIPGWDEGSAGARTLMVAVDADGDQIIWGGLVRDRDSTPGPWVDVSANTLEAYLSRRYINTPLSWDEADPAQIAVDVLAGVVADLTPLTVSATMTGNESVGGAYTPTDNKRVGDILSDLSGLAGGIEWTVDLEWADADHTQMRYVVRIAPRLGTPGGVSATQWTMPGCVRSFRLKESFGEENFANDVLAYSSGEGGSQPWSTRYEDTPLLASFARFERRFPPATSITSTTTLDQYAEAELARVRLGVTQLNIEANLDAAPQVNRDWWLGDDIDVALTCDRFPRRLDAEGFWQPGYTRRLRTVGWDLDFDTGTIVPRILEAA
ncbi:hypothetical protein [Nocardioides sp. LHG3406-4]|uniref:hypothetical protein n=1 Tax=Nocardioides sp. LHG3406-4 TaxID=2804575 RepID=UPI003CF558C9